MKIGIVTPYDSANCGAYLQAYANKCFLEKNNYNVCFIQWRNEKQRKKEYFSKPKTIKELIRCIQRYPFLCARYKRMTQLGNLVITTSLCPLTLQLSKTGCNVFVVLLFSFHWNPFLFLPWGLYC